MSDSLAVVTGAASGLGRVIAETLSNHGAHVVVADHDASAGADFVHHLSLGGHGATFIHTDASYEPDVRRLVAEVATLGRLDVLVNNAGGWLPGPQFPDVDHDVWSGAIDLNLRMPMLATQLCLPLMASGGAVVNVSSAGGWDSAAYGSPEYGAAKAGLIRFTTAVADFTTRFGVRVSCVVPHWIGLERALREYADMSPDEQQSSGGLIDPQVVAETVLRLTLDPASGGRVVIIKAGHRPYVLDPAAADPRHRP